MAYDAKDRQWNRSVTMYYEQLAQERNQMKTFQTVSATPLPVSNSGRHRSSSQEVNNSNTANNIDENNTFDAESAAALILSAKASIANEVIVPLKSKQNTEEESDVNGTFSNETLEEKESELMRSKEKILQELKNDILIKSNFLTNIFFLISKNCKSSITLIDFWWKNRNFHIFTFINYFRYFFYIS